MNQMSRYIKLVSFLGETLGNAFEAILFDVTDDEYPIAASANVRDSSIRKAREFVKRAMNDPSVGATGYLAGYPVKISESKLSKMSVFFVSDDESVKGALCICMRCDVFLKMQSVIGDFLRFRTEDLENEGADRVFSSVSENPSLDGIHDYVRAFGIDPERTNHDEKKEVICDLYDMGVFNLKGAVAKTAEELRISTKSVYRYLSQIKSMRD